MAGFFNWNEQGKFDSFDQAKDHVRKSQNKNRFSRQKSRQQIIFGLIAILVILAMIASFVFFFKP